MDKAALLALADRVEALTGPDRDVDALIGLAALGFFICEPRYEGAPVAYGYVDKDGSRIEPGHGGKQLIRDYTATLDAAMALVPEGWVVASLEWWPMRNRGGVCLREVKDFDKEGGFGFGFDKTCGDARSHAATATLALTAASLRARVSQ